MPGRDCPVHLTHAAPFDVQPNQLVFYDVIELGTAARSGVLSTIADAGGEARLPDAITLSEFKRWITFVEGYHDDTTEESFLNLCTVVKVTPADDCPSACVVVELPAAAHRRPNDMSCFLIPFC